MPVTLGRAGGAPTGATAPTGIISVTHETTVETVDVTHRGVSTSPAYRQATGGFITRTTTVECLDATAVMTALHLAQTGWTITSVSENQPLDGPVTFTVTVKQT